MRSRTSVETTDVGSEVRTEPTEAEQKALLEEAIQKREKLAESHLDMARLFVENQKFDIARRRLQQLIEEFAGSAAACGARALLQTLKHKKTANSSHDSRSTAIPGPASQSRATRGPRLS